MPKPAGHDIIVVGASAGGVEALTGLVRGLPSDLPAAVLVVLHIPPQARSHLPEILSRSGPLPAHHPRDGEPLRHGQIYIAPPDHHLLVERDCARVMHGPRENRYRPAVDPLFRSAAVAFGPRVVAVVLSGALDDGTAGLLAVKRMGGIAIVQDPAEALVANMPAHAIEYVQVDHIVRIAELGALLNTLAHQPPAKGAPAVPEDLRREVSFAEGDPQIIGTPPPGKLTTYACPDCGGPLWEVYDEDLPRFRCRNGHGLTVESMLDGTSAGLEEALWAALNALENSSSVAEQVAKDAHARGHTLVAERMEEKATLARSRGALIRRVLLENGTKLERGNDLATDSDATLSPHASSIA